MFLLKISVKSTYVGWIQNLKFLDEIKELGLWGWKKIANELTQHGTDNV